MRSLSVPAFFSIELTSDCNNFCSFCSNVFSRNQACLGFYGWQKIIDQIKHLSHSLKLTGGEPTLHPDFYRIVNYLSQNNLNFTLFTNARWKEPIEVITFLKSVPQCKGLLVSLHGVDADSHERLTQVGGSFEETCSNILLAAESGVRIHQSIILTKLNYNRINEVVVLAEKLKVKRIVFNRYLGKPAPPIEAKPEQLLFAMREIEQINRKGDKIQLHYGNCIPQCFFPSASTGCLAGVAYCTIDPQGNLRPCNHSPTVAGNILGEPIEKVWQNNIMQRWRESLPKQCVHCLALEICHGGCRAQAEILKIKSDPLIRESIRDKNLLETVDLSLFEDSKPQLNCSVRKESFGFALLNGQSLVFVAPEAIEILSQFAEGRRLKDFQNKFGSAAVHLIGVLYLNGLVNLD